MVGSQDAQSVAQVLFEQVDGLVEPARGLVGVRKIVLGGQGVGVVGPQDVRLVGQSPLTQVDGLVEPARGLVGVRKIVLGGQGAGGGRAPECVRSQ